MIWFPLIGFTCGVFLSVLSFYSKSEKERNKTAALGIILLCFSTGTFLLAGLMWGYGHPVTPESKLVVGDTYTLLTDCVKVSRDQRKQYDRRKQDDYFYAILRKDDGTIYALYFNAPIPKRGVVTENQEGQMVFLPLSESVEK